MIFLKELRSRSRFEKKTNLQYRLIVFKNFKLTFETFDTFLQFCIVFFQCSVMFITGMWILMRRKNKTRKEISTLFTSFSTQYAWMIVTTRSLFFIQSIILELTKGNLSKLFHFLLFQVRVHEKIYRSQGQLLERAHAWINIYKKKKEWMKTIRYAHLNQDQ